MAEHHVMLSGSKRHVNSSTKRLRDANPAGQIEVTISLRGPALPDADNLPDKALGHEAFEANYGARPEDANKVVQVLEKYGLKIEEVSLVTRSMRVSGTVAAIEAAFHPNLGIYHNAEQGEFRGRESDIKIPGELDGLITGVFGLDQRRVARRKSLNSQAVPTTPAALTPFTLEDIETRYNFPPGDGEGCEVAIAEFGGNYSASDLNAFCAKYQRPVPTVAVVYVNELSHLVQKVDQLLPSKRETIFEETREVMMDVELIAGLCPKAHITVYFAQFDQKGWIDLLNKVILDKPVTLSISWGASENDSRWSQAAITAVNERLSAIAVLGITSCVGTGDDGSGNGLNDEHVHVEFPSVSPFVLSVGGTMLTGTPPDIVEQTWWETPGQRLDASGKPTGGGATGGGVSVFLARPQWQNCHITSLNKNCIDGRITPDVAALAGPPWYSLILDGKDALNGGTSAAAPVWAALIARINACLPADKRQRFLTRILYQAGSNGQPLGQSVCHDITIGQNASLPKPGVGYEAQPGYDAVTGWGTPDGVALLAALKEL